MALLAPTLAPAPVMEDAPLEARRAGDDYRVGGDAGTDTGREGLLSGGGRSR